MKDINELTPTERKIEIQLWRTKHLAGEKISQEEYHRALQLLRSERLNRSGKIPKAKTTKARKPKKEVVEATFDDFTKK